jgi:hypothetical protein
VLNDNVRVYWLLLGLHALAWVPDQGMYSFELLCSV